MALAACYRTLANKQLLEVKGKRADRSEIYVVVEKIKANTQTGDLPAVNMANPHKSAVMQSNIQSSNQKVCEYWLQKLKQSNHSYPIIKFYKLPIMLGTKFSIWLKKFG